MKIRISIYKYHVDLRKEAKNSLKQIVCKISSKPIARGLMEKKNIIDKKIEADRKDR